MATPEFVLALREKIGTAPLPLVGTTAVVFRDEKVLLGKRADNGEWRCVSGIVDPGEEPADAAARECLEEAGVVVRVERLALVHQVPRITYANGDQADYLDLVFRCTWVSGDPHPADGEKFGMTEKNWMNRILFLESVAGVPGMVAGMLRHLRSLRTMKRDNGWYFFSLSSQFHIYIIDTCILMLTSQD